MWWKTEETSFIWDTQMKNKWNNKIIARQVGCFYISHNQAIKQRQGLRKKAKRMRKGILWWRGETENQRKLDWIITKKQITLINWNHMAEKFRESDPMEAEQNKLYSAPKKWFKSIWIIELSARWRCGWKAIQADPRTTSCCSLWSIDRTPRLGQSGNPPARYTNSANRLWKFWRIF